MLKYRMGGWFSFDSKPGFNSQPLSFNTNMGHGYRSHPNNTRKKSPSKSLSKSLSKSPKRPTSFGAFSNMLNKGYVPLTRNKLENPLYKPNTVTATVKSKRRGLFDHLGI